MNILVLGYFGYVTNQIDGQTIKTRDVYSLLKDNCKEDINYFDTQSFKESKLNLIKMLWMVLRADTIFYLPAQNNLKYLFPIIYLISKMVNAKLNYLVVGGWLFDFIKNMPIHRYMLKNIKGIYTETEHLYTNLSIDGFNNINKLHNFRIIDFPIIREKEEIEGKIKLVFMARVHPFKGANLLFEIEKYFKSLGINNISIDIYGPVFKDYEEYFFTNIKKSSMKYHGVIDPTKVYAVLAKYDMMLFPTKYYTEGFPGSILDAYISGIPVIATNWLNAKEFIDDGKTGYIVAFDDDKLFIKKLEKLVKKPISIYSLKNNIEKKRHEYSSQKAWIILEKAIYNDRC